jgi:ElaB/YqjD/DUF883 family membrane-anchored ribosome-binding protein
MLTRPEIEAEWTAIKQAIRRRWAVLGGEELDEARTSAGRLVGIIQQRTGDGRQEIEVFLEQLVRGRAWAAHRALQQSIAQHPTCSVLVTFAAGFIAGALIATSANRSR